MKNSPLVPHPPVSSAGWPGLAGGRPGGWVLAGRLLGSARLPAAVVRPRLSAPRALTALQLVGSRMCDGARLTELAERLQANWLAGPGPGLQGDPAPDLTCLAWLHTASLLPANTEARAPDSTLGTAVERDQERKGSIKPKKIQIHQQKTSVVKLCGHFTQLSEVAKLCKSLLISPHCEWLL